MIQRAIGAPIRRLPLPLFVLISTGIWLVVLSAALMTVPYLVSGVAYGEDYEVTTFEQDLLFAFIASRTVSASLPFNSAFKASSLFV